MSINRGGIVITIGTVLVLATAVVGAFIGVRSLARLAHGQEASRCEFGGHTLTTEQAQVAATMVGVTTRAGLPEHADVLVLMAAMQESHLTNVPAGQGDRDSVGVLQQRPSQGWGTTEQLSEIGFATQAFLGALVKVPGWQTMNAADAIQAVQISADGGAYAQHEALATALADALTGRTPASIWCRSTGSDDAYSPDQVAAAVQQELPIQAPTVNERLVTVPGAHWQTAAWFVVNADRLGLDRVQFAGKSWRPNQHWTTDPGATSTAVVATLQAAA